MPIKGLENITAEQLSQEVMRGGKFVVFQYCVSLLIVTLRLNSSVYFIRAEENTVGKSGVFSLISLLLGWWGFPWGPIYTVASLYTNFKGGKDVTMETMNALDGKSASTTLI